MHGQASLIRPCWSCITTAFGYARIDVKLPRGRIVKWHGSACSLTSSHKPVLSSESLHKSHPIHPIICCLLHLCSKVFCDFVMVFKKKSLKKKKLCETGGSSVVLSSSIFTSPSDENGKSEQGYVLGFHEGHSWSLIVHRDGSNLLWGVTCRNRDGSSRIRSMFFAIIS